MVEAAGAYGPWFEWKRVELKSKKEIQPDPKRLAYQKECGRIFSGLWRMNYALIDRVGIRVNTPSLGDGLILRKTFKERDSTYRDKLNPMAFLVTQNGIFKVGPLTPRALEKAEKAGVDYRLSRLKLVSDKIGVVDLFCENNRDSFWDAERFCAIIEQSVERAATKVSLEEYITKVINLN